MHAFLIDHNSTVRISQEEAGIFYYNNIVEDYEFEVEDDGEEDYELYNDEDYYNY